MKKIAVLLFFLCFYFNPIFAGELGQATILNPTINTVYKYKYNSTDYYDRTTLNQYIGKYSSLLGHESETFRCILRFDLTGIPDSAIITSVAFNINATVDTLPFTYKIAAFPYNTSGAQNEWTASQSSTVYRSGISTSASSPYFVYTNSADTLLFTQMEASLASNQFAVCFVSEDENTNMKFATLNGSSVTVYYTFPSVTINNDFGAGNVKVNDVSYLSGSNFITKVGRQFKIQAINQTYNGVMKYFVKWHNPDGTTTTNNPYTFSVKKSYNVQNYVAEFGNPVHIIAENNFHSGTLTSDSVTVNSGDTLSKPNNVNTTISSINQQFGDTNKVWNNYAPNNKSQWYKKVGLNSVPIDTAYSPQYTHKVLTSDEGAHFIAYMKNNYKMTRSDATEFSGTYNNMSTIYIVEQNSDTLAAPSTFNSPPNLYYFAGWTDDFSAPANRTITPTTNHNYTALYKAKNNSNSISAYSNSSQRKLIRTPDGILHKVYESMGHVWYETSNNNGNSWTINNNGHPLDNGAGKLPSIDYYGNTVAIVFQQQNGSYYTIQGKVFYAYSGNYIFGIGATIYTEIYDSYSVNANPNVSWGYNSKSIITWERKYSAFGDPLSGINYAYGSINYNNITLNGTGWINGTDNNSINATISTNKVYSDTARFHLAWEQFNNNYSRQIYYCKNNISNTWIITSTMPQNISSGDGYLWNYSPSIISAADGSTRVSWIGDYYGNNSMVNIVYHDPGYYRFWTFGYNVRSNSITLSDDNLTGYFAWSQNYGGNSYSNNFTCLNTLAQPKTLNTTGKDIQLSNGAGPANMYAESFLPFSLPYYFQTSNNLASFPKTNPNSINCGRGTVIAKNGAEFNYMLGDITVDGKDIGFVNTEINSDFSNLDKIDSVFISQPFSLKENSDFNISELYGIKDSVAALSLLGADDFINYKVELIDASNDNLLGSIDNITVNSSNLISNKLSLYQVNTTGFGGKTVKIKITESSNIPDAKIALIEKYADESVLGKISPQRINIQGSSVIKDYALEQNYPNPFNPSTVITYRVPKAGMVTLKIFDMLGNEVTTLVNEIKNTGRYDVNFDASKFASGVYIYQIKSNEYVSSKKMMLLK